MADEISRDIGRLDGRVTALEGRADRFEASVASTLASINAKLDGVQTTLSQSRGGLRVIHILVTVAGGAAAALVGTHFHIP